MGCISSKAVKSNQVILPNIYQRSEEDDKIEELKFIKEFFKTRYANSPQN